LVPVVGAGTITRIERIEIRTRHAGVLIVSGFRSAQSELSGFAMRGKPSVGVTGYWQGHIAA
jgi:hypothetical protein